MKRHIFLASAFTALLLSACSSDEPNVNDNDGVRGDDAEKYELNAGLYDTAEECFKANPGRDGGPNIFYFAVGPSHRSERKYMTECQYYEVPQKGEFLAVNRVSMIGDEKTGGNLFVGNIENNKHFKYEDLETNPSDIDGCTAWTTVESEDEIQKLLEEAHDAELVWRTSWTDYIDLPKEYGDLQRSNFGSVGISIPVNTTGKTRVMAWNFGADHLNLSTNPSFIYHYRHPLLIVQRAK